VSASDFFSFVPRVPLFENNTAILTFSYFSGPRTRVSQLFLGRAYPCLNSLLFLRTDLNPASLPRSSSITPLTFRLCTAYASTAHCLTLGRLQPRNPFFPSLAFLWPMIRFFRLTSRCFFLWLITYWLELRITRNLDSTPGGPPSCSSFDPLLPG